MLGNEIASNYDHKPLHFMQIKCMKYEMDEFLTMVSFGYQISIRKRYPRMHFLRIKVNSPWDLLKVPLKAFVLHNS